MHEEAKRIRRLAYKFKLMLVFTIQWGAIERNVDL